MTDKPMTKEQQIQMMLKQRVITIDNPFERKGFVQNFSELASDKFSSLSKNIFGDYSYQRKNNLSVENKLKILDYLKEKSLMLSSNLRQQNKKNYYTYDPDFFNKKPPNLALMKQMLLQGKSQVQTAEGSLERTKSSRDFIRAQFLNEAAYQFDRQRYCSIYWGFLTGCLINATIYKNGRLARKAALLVTIAHVFGQVSYHLNLDKYFDSVYRIFEEEAELYMSEQKKRLKNGDKLFIKNQIQ